ncbi:MAG: nicotinamide mononucleotide transporter [Cyanobacteria bacterium SIG26]|nr:nicotinamide mononucleotide transporter [Cyanobacteria bacterium SIG26]
MTVIDFVKKELDGWGKYEKVVFPVCVLSIILMSILINDSKIALISAICGISYTILAGKGKISCYFIGLCGTLCYSFISWQNGLFGNLALYLLYYLPMQILGIFKWKQHLKKDIQEIKKTRLSNKDKVIYFSTTLVLTILCYFILISLNDKSPIFDAITSVFSIAGLLLTVKRCIEQWYIWFVVNGLSMVMWIEAYLNGSNCFVTIMMWAIYLILSVYFLYTWKKELNDIN